MEPDGDVFKFGLWLSQVIYEGGLWTAQFMVFKFSIETMNVNNTIKELLFNIL